MANIGFWGGSGYILTVRMVVFLQRVIVQEHPHNISLILTFRGGGCHYKIISKKPLRGMIMKNKVEKHRHSEPHASIVQL